MVRVLCELAMLKALCEDGQLTGVEMADWIKMVSEELGKRPLQIHVFQHGTDVGHGTQTDNLKHRRKYGRRSLHRLYGLRGGND